MLKTRKSSLSLRILRVCFIAYLVMAAVITAIEVISHHHNAKIEVFKSLVDLSQTLNDSLTRSLWNYNYEQINATMSGLDNVAMISGAKVVQADDSIYASTGSYPTLEEVISSKKIAFSLGDIEEITYESERGIQVVYSYSFPIIQAEKNRRILVGRCFFYTDSSAVWDRVQNGVLVILLGSLVKAAILCLILIMVIRVMVVRKLALIQVVLDAISEGETSNNEADFQRLLRVKTHDELTFLARSVANLRHFMDEKLTRASDYALSLESRMADRSSRMDEMAEKLEQMAAHDSLTGLDNRVSFERKLAQMCDRAASNDLTFGVVRIDLSHFQDVNDRFGHHTGDRVLIEMSARLKSILSPGDSIARVGGDEFALLLPKVDRHLSSVIAERISSCVDIPILVDGENIFVGVGIGIALFPEHDKEPDVLHRCAEMALHLAKKNERGFALYSSSQSLELRRLASIERDLASALAKEQISLCYQPVVSATNGKVMATEALMRWRHPVLGDIDPLEFVTIAERSVNIKRLNSWLLKRAIADARIIIKKYGDLIMSINVSSKILADQNFPGLIAEVAGAEQIDPNSIWLEVAEAAVLHNPERTLEVLKQLKELGFRITITGFGTGYSVFNYLTSNHVDLLKIDRRLLLNYSPSSALLVKTIIELAHKLNIQVVAEGVENEAIAALLKKQECDYLQGFYFSKPLDIDALFVWLDENA